MESKPKCPIHGERSMKRTNGRWGNVRYNRIYWLCRVYNCNYRIEVSK